MEENKNFNKRYQSAASLDGALKPLFLVSTNAQELQQKSGVVLGRQACDSPNFFLDTSTENVLTTGEDTDTAGKRISIAIPTANIWKTSLVCFDPTQEIYRQTSKARKAMGQPVYYFCPDEPTKSLHWNPLAEAYESWCDAFQRIECHEREILHALTVSLFDLDTNKTSLGKHDETLKTYILYSQAACLFEWICLYFFWKHQQQKLPAPTFADMQKALATTNFGRDYQRFTEQIREKKIDILNWHGRVAGDLFSLQPAAATPETIQTIQQVILPFTKGRIADIISTSDISLYDLVDTDQPCSLYFCMDSQYSLQDQSLQERIAKIFLHVFLAELLPLHCEPNPESPDIMDLLLLLDKFPSCGSFLPILDYLEKSNRLEGLYCHGTSGRARRVKLCLLMKCIDSQELLEACPIQIHFKDSLGLFYGAALTARYLGEEFLQRSHGKTEDSFFKDVLEFYQDITTDLGEDKEICLLPGKLPVLLETATNLDGNGTVHP